ncbi:MAG: DeoR/GlpR family DNA-binding transcription regulator [Actinomycetota bacterium]
MADGTLEPPSLFQGERQREIAALTLESGRVEVSELSERFGVTTETIRRDLSELQERGVVRRVHGGAVPWETIGFEPLLSVRTDLRISEKRLLARVAIDELPNGGSVIIDSGSTLTRFAEAIPWGTELRVVTNSLLTAQVLAERSGLDVSMIGGELRKKTLAVVDADAVATVERLVADTLFISSDGFSPENGLSTPYPAEAALKRAMIAAAKRVVVLVDDSKLGKDHLVRFAEWTDVDVLITNEAVPASAVAAIEASGTTVRLA